MIHSRPLTLILAILVACLVANDAAAERIQLKFKWSPGEPTRYELSETMQQEITGPLASKLHWRRTITYTERLIQQDDSGSRIERAYDAVRVTVIRDQQPPVQFDSAAPDPENAKNLLVAPFVGLAGKTIRFTILPNGTIAEIEGAAEALDAMFLPLEQGGLTQGLRDARRSPVRNDRIARQIEQALRFVPGKPVRPGDRWPVEIDHATPLSANLSSDIVATFKGKEPATGDAEISLEGTLGQSAADDEVVQGLLGITLDAGSITGHILFDTENGQIASSTMQLSTAWTVGGGLVQGTEPMRQRIKQYAELKRQR